MSTQWKLFGLHREVTGSILCSHLHVCWRAFILSALVLACLIGSAHPEVTSESDVTSASTMKGRNSDLLAFKMFDELEHDELRKQAALPDSEHVISVGRVQRHAAKRRRHGNRKRKQAKLRGNVTQEVKNAFKRLIPSKTYDLGPAPSEMKSPTARGFCKTVPFVQWINITGCIPRGISNSYCYGVCPSFFIPSYDQHRDFHPFTTCQSCTPKRSRWVNIEITCPQFGNDDFTEQRFNLEDNRILQEHLRSIGPNVEEVNQPLNVRKIFKKVLLVKKCSCKPMACSKQQH